MKKLKDKKSLQKAKEFYQMTGLPGSVETQITKTSNGNYVYRHFLSGNSPQESRLYNPVSGEDIILENGNYFHYLTVINNLPMDIQPGFIIGKEVEKSFGKRLKKLPTVNSFFMKC